MEINCQGKVLMMAYRRIYAPWPTFQSIRQIIALGRGTLLAKIDIKSAFRLIPVHPSDRHLLAMEWQGFLYIDTCLPWLAVGPKIVQYYG